MEEGYRTWDIAENVHLKTTVLECVVKGVPFLVDVFTFRIPYSVPKTKITLVGLRALENKLGMGMGGKIRT